VGAGNMFASIIIFPFVILAAIVWAAIGLFFWIPMLAKSVTIFTFSVLASAIVNRPAASSAKNLERAIVYYIHGFAIIFSTLNVRRYSEDHSEDVSGSSGSLIVSIFSNLALIFNTVVFASIFWLMFLLFVHHLGVLNVPLVGYWEAWLLSNLRMPR
jgi:hypothetical protein